MLYLHVLQLCIASEGKMDLTSLSKSFVVYEGWLVALQLPQGY